MSERRNYINNNWAEMWIDGKVLVIKYKDNCILDLEAGKKILEDRLMLSDGKSYPIHGDCRGVKYWTKECREFQTTKENYALVTAGTILYTESHVVNVLLNFFLKFNKVPFPTKFCSDEEEAIDWLQQFI